MNMNITVKQKPCPYSIRVYIARAKMHNAYRAFLRKPEDHEAYFNLRLAMIKVHDEVTSGS